MSWLTINGVELKKMVALGGDPSGDRRDIGAQTEASDGSITVTRQTRKRDQKLSSVPLTNAAAQSWESLLVGDGNVWPFDSSFYSSKGVVGTTGAPLDVLVQGSIKKFGAGALQIASGEEWASSVKAGVNVGGTGPYTFALWMRGLVATTWHHYVNRYDGVTLDSWLDGVRGTVSYDDMLAFLGDGSFVLKSDFLAEQSYFDDVVVCPYLWLDAWPAQVYAAGRAFGQLPFLTAAGDLVPEASTRKMVCSSISDKVMIARVDGQLRRDAKVLAFELKGA